MSLGYTEVILASASPRRQELLYNIGLQFRVQAADVDEKLPCGIAPTSAVRMLAEAKAVAVATKHPQAIVIGADTIVTCENHVLGKPANREEAAHMLRFLSGRSHQVITGVAVVGPANIYRENLGTDKCDIKHISAGAGGANSQVLVSHEVTTVLFSELTERQIAAYVATDEPLDKAGAYGIQGRAGLFVPRIEGCYFNIVGLPVARLAQMLSHFGLLLP